MRVAEKKQTRIVFRSTMQKRGNQFRYNSSGRVKKPVVFNKNRNPLSFVVDWQLSEAEEEEFLE